MKQNTVNITKYYNSVIAAQVNKSIDFKKSKYLICKEEEVARGFINKEAVNKFFIQVKKSKNEYLDVIICEKTIKTKFKNELKVENNIDELTGIYYIPAKLKKNGTLYYDKHSRKLPWIAREYMEPIIENQLSVGYVKKFDKFIEDNIGLLNKIETFSEFYNFSRMLYQSASKSDKEIMENFDNRNKIEFDTNRYIFLDDRINAVGSIKRLYDDLEKTNENCRLYEKITDMSYEKLVPIVPNSLNNMKKHFGQMGGEYPLSESQREAINCFNNLGNGEIMAVNGPPGTGKTTLLQSVVANMYVDRAIKKDKAPVIVVSSTNNQAVTNIIESFGNIKKINGNSNFEERWIEKADSFAVYFPSTSKKREAERHGYQFTDKKGKDFIDETDNEENIKASTEKFLKNFNEYYNSNFIDISICKEIIHKRLIELDTIKNSLLDIVSDINNVYGNISIKDRISSLNIEIRKLKADVEHNRTRLNEWEEHFKSYSFFTKLFKNRRSAKNKIFINHDEDFLRSDMKYEAIEDAYGNRIKAINEKINKLISLKEKAEKMYFKYLSLLNALKKFKIHINEDFLNLEKLNNVLDTTVRYKEFWLAVHYYECRWLDKEYSLTTKQKGKTYKNVLESLFSRLALQVPCSVMTFFTLPNVFYADGNPKNREYMYNFIDLLIVDEAGQVSPEIAACSFSLAKKAVVVGDIYQIEPVWGIEESLDKSLALESKVIYSVNDFHYLKELGMTSSSSSLMKMAAKSCKFKKKKDRGLFLKEHRRCYNEIINYCNELVYNGDLEALRGSGKDDKNNKLKNFPQFGYKQIDSSRSSKVGGSRKNDNEAKAIALWVKENIDMISSAYSNEKAENLIGIIAPFKAQISLISEELRKTLGSSIASKISVGTVHSFQGAEKIIIIMSTVYGREDGCYFIDANENLMNVAVSRAKNNFFVFGDINCLSKSKNEASGLLREYLNDNII